MERTGAVLVVPVGELPHTAVTGTMRRLIRPGQVGGTGFALAVELSIDDVSARV
ncbi:hypothetical protein [Actinoplanes sp. G11-F43]|uniref:hypothetical protein n=1 Tax=Actinoplanes sp. G11-F43 TaxID=3424130 RepID=UPI003D33E606